MIMKRTKEQATTSNKRRKEAPLGDSEDVGVFPTDMWLLILNFVPLDGVDQALSEISQTCKSIYKLCNQDWLWKMRYAGRFNTPIQFLSDTVDSNFLAKDLKPRKDDPIQDLWQRRYQHRKSLKSAMPEPEADGEEHFPYFNLKIDRYALYRRDAKKPSPEEEAAIEEERRQYQITPYRGPLPETVIFIGSTGIPVTVKWDIDDDYGGEYNFRVYAYSVRKSQWKLIYEIVPDYRAQEDAGYYYPLSNTIIRALTRVSIAGERRNEEERRYFKWRFYECLLVVARIDEDAECVHANGTCDLPKCDSDDEEYQFEGEEKAEKPEAGGDLFGGTPYEGTVGTYHGWTVRRAGTIKEQFYNFGVGYKAGNGYYLLTKNEKVSEKKKVLVIDKDGNFFDDHKVVLQKLKRKSMEGNICPMKDLKIFVQSSSPSRMMDIGVEWIAVISVKK